MGSIPGLEDPLEKGMAPYLWIFVFTLLRDWFPCAGAVLSLAQTHRGGPQTTSTPANQKCSEGTSLAPHERAVRDGRGGVRSVN